MITSRQRFGDAGEKAAEEALVKDGYRIVARKHRCPRGEVERLRFVRPSAEASAK